MNMFVSNSWKVRAQEGFLRHLLHHMLCICRGQRWTLIREAIGLPVFLAAVYKYMERQDLLYYAV